MGLPTDIRVVGSRLYWIPVQTRVPLKFGSETVTSVTCARVRITVTGRCGRVAQGWGETPLSVQWVWPSARPFGERQAAIHEFTRQLATAWPQFAATGHPVEIGHDFLETELPRRLHEFNHGRPEPMPHLAALVCASAYDLALHDAFGNFHGRPTYETYGREFFSRDLSAFLTVEPGVGGGFQGRYPADFLVTAPARRLLAWHLVGGLDPLEPADLTGAEPVDEHPVLLADWIRRDGLRCLKVKLRGSDPTWDYDRLVRVGRIAVAEGVDWLTADFNCTVQDPAVVNETLDRLRDQHPRLYGMLLYVEQPFPYDLAAHRCDVRSVAGRKPLYLDESAHDWRVVRLGRELGWSGVALKTCKTQTGALLAACWARRHGMGLMVQDLTNPMLAQIPHCLLAAHVGTIMGVETNAMQFYPEASLPEASIHPGLYRRTDGRVDLSTLGGPGFGYRVAEIPRELGLPVVAVGD